MLIRLRTNIGMWRVTVDTPDYPSLLGLLGTTATLTTGISTTPFTETSDATATFIPSTATSLTAPPYNVTNGTMLYCFVTGTSTCPGLIAPTLPTKRIINKDGDIEAMNYDDSIKGDAWRPGMLPLRAMKKHWTIGEFMDMDDSFNFKIKGAGESMCGIANINSMELDSFQSYLRAFDFGVCRMGFLYGTVEAAVKGKGLDAGAKPKVRVEFCYEPPQTGDALKFELIESAEADSELERAENLAGLLGLTRVGWIFSTPPREEGFQFNCDEVIMAGELQLEAAQGVEDTSFVTVKATVDSEGKAVFDAFQVSKQAMEMCAEGALEPSTKPGFCKVSPTFTAIVEGKEAKEIDNNFMLAVVPIEMHQTSDFVSLFPKRNREGSAATHDEMRKQLSKSGTNGWTFTNLLADFQLLLYLCDFLDIGGDVTNIAAAIKEKRDVDEGYKIIISSMCGLEGY